MTSEKSIQHIAFIMDGNRRWALEQGREKIEGHEEGAKNIHTILEACNKLGVQNVSLYAFSTENWKRTKAEVDALTGLMRRFFLEDGRERLRSHAVRVRFVGDLADFEEDLVQELRKLEEETAGHDKTVFVCLSYGGRREMVQAACAMREWTGPWDEESFRAHLWSHDMPDIDLLVRTGGNRRLSNFLPWQAAYAELYFTDTYWPAFGAEELENLVNRYYRDIQINRGA